LHRCGATLAHSARTFRASGRGELPDDATIIYGVFMPVGEPGTSSPFGRMFVELVASRLAQHGVGVVEVRLRDAVAMREGGPYALSDDARDVARRVQLERPFRVRTR
jgi:hypothetical protein